MLRGDDLGQLAAAVGERLERYAGVTGGLRLAGDFLPNLQATVARFNELAATGKDTDLAGERAVEQLFNGVVKEEPGRANPTMWPLAGTGSYYAALVTGGTLDTKGGPKATPDGQVLDDQDRPIPGSVRGGQLRRLGLGPGLLGRRGDPRPDPRPGPPGGHRGGRRTGRTPANQLVPSRKEQPWPPRPSR